MARSAWGGAEYFSRRRRGLLQTAASVAAFWPMLGRTQTTEVALAGLAYSGDYASLDQRFPYSRNYEASSTSAGVNAKLAAATSQNAPKNFKLVGQIDELKGRDQAIAVALIVTGETVSTEPLAGIYKSFVLIRAQALFFDFKSKSVLRSYPISFASILLLNHLPTPDEIRGQVRTVFEGGASGKPGLFLRFADTLAGATLPATSSRYLQVTNMVIKPEALRNIPAYLSSSSTLAETWGADLVGEALSTRAGVPIIPFAKGYAIGNRMSMRISDGTVYDLVLPKPDYSISVDLSSFKKIEYGKAPAGTSYIYGSYASVKIEEPLSGKVYFNSVLKNGEVKVVPVTQTYVDDFPAYYDSVNYLFVKLSEALAGKGTDWIKTAAAAADIEKQVAETRELIRLCK